MSRSTARLSHPVGFWFPRVGTFILSLVFVQMLGAIATPVHAVAPIPDRREFPVDPKFSPCVDFFKYACNQVQSGFELRPDRSRHTFSFSDSDERILEFKKAYFKKLHPASGTGAGTEASKEPATSKPASASLASEGALAAPLTSSGKSLEQLSEEREAALKTVYQGCMNPQAREVEERALVARTKAELTALKTPEDLQKYLAKRILSPEFSVVGFGVIPNQDHSEFNDLYLSFGLRSLPERSYYAKPEVVTELEGVLQKFFDTVGELGTSEKSAERSKARAKRVIEFETQFAQVMPLPAEMREIVSSRTGIEREALLKNFPAFGLQELMGRVPNSVHIRHFYPKGMEWLHEKLQRWPLEDLKDLVLYHGVSGEMDDAYPEFFKARFDFRHRRLGGPPTRPEREERCTRMVMGTFAHELDSILWPRYFRNFDRNKAVAVAEKVRKTLLTELKENTWLSASARKEAIAKIKKSTLQLVAPRTEKEWDFLPLGKYRADTPIANAHQASWLSGEKNLKELGKPQPKERWGMGPMTVNAYFSPSHNKFVLPVGILQYPFFDSKQSVEANLGAMGSVVGHELGHAVDDQGSKYDSQGRLREWMSKEDLAAFKERTESLKEQFKKVGHNGELTLGENIGDLVGVSTAYRAAFGSDNQTLSEKEKKRRQDFFLGWARVWCSVERESSIELRLKTDPHSLSFARTNEPLKHLAGFEHAFACKAGDPMVLPEKSRVKVW